MTDTPTPVAAPLATIDSIHATVAQEVSSRAEKLARMKAIQTRIQAVQDLQAKLNAEADSIKTAFDAEMGAAA